MKNLIALALVFLLCACTVVKVEKVPLADGIEGPQDARPSPVGLNKIRYAIPTGTTTMGVSTRSLRCPLVMRKIERGISERSFVSDSYKRIFNDTLEGQGYDTTGDPGRLFDEEEDMQRTAYAIGARVTDIKMDVCMEQSLFFGYDLGLVGEAMVEIEWSVFDMLRRRNIYKTTTKGYADLRNPNDEGVDLLLEDAFAAATHNLAADKAFHDLIFRGIKPEVSPSTFGDPEEPPVAMYDPREAVNLPQQILHDPGSSPELEIQRKAVVMIQTSGHGSGFFITKEGHILTNEHVIGNADRVRVVISGRKKAFIAEVLRVDPLRDVALLKLEALPEDLPIVTLPMRFEKPGVGEDVYAIGAPGITKLQDTVTKGIVSAHRYDRRRKLWFIQSDVFVYGGNSGGPLLDAQGNIIGMTVAGYTFGDALNLFIPIEDVLAYLDIGVNGQAVVPPAAPDDQAADFSPVMPVEEDKDAAEKGAQDEAFTP